MRGVDEGWEGVATMISYVVMEIPPNCHGTYRSAGDWP